MWMFGQKHIDKAHRRGKVGWNVGRHIEVAPHYRRPHMTLVWTGSARAVPKVVPRRGSVVHREKVEKVPSGFGGVGTEGDVFGLAEGSGSSHDEV